MLYLDSSALVKSYINETGTTAVRDQLSRPEKIFTSALSFAEVHTVLGRKYQAKELPRPAFEAARDAFVMDWIVSLLILELDVKTLSGVPDLVERFPLKASDAVHLASALWLRDMLRLSSDFAAGESVLEFWVADKTLARIARECGLEVFNPEASA